MIPKFLILSGDGINCEMETALAFKEAGGKSEIVHINDLLDRPTMMDEYDGLAIPGGFSFGDELGSGQILALKIKTKLMAHFNKFISDKKPIIGICNGFQVLVKLGFLPNPDLERSLTLTYNEDGKFIDKWTNMVISKNTNSPWLKELAGKSIRLPVRHGEGRIVFKKDKISDYDTLQENGQIALTYENDINGSFENIAGLTDPTGLIFGLMPHPEAYISEVTAPTINSGRLDSAVGLIPFKSIINYINNKEA